MMQHSKFNITKSTDLNNNSFSLSLIRSHFIIFNNRRQTLSSYNNVLFRTHIYPRRARSAIGVDIVFTLDVCLHVSALERKRLIEMT